MTTPNENNQSFSDLGDIAVRSPVAAAVGITAGVLQFKYLEASRMKKLALAKQNAAAYHAETTTPHHFHETTRQDHAFAASLVGIGMLAAGFALTGVTKTVNQFFTNKGQQLARFVQKKSASANPDIA